MTLIGVDSAFGYAAEMPRKPKKAAEAGTRERPNRIPELTKANKTSYRRIAEELGVHPITIANLARGKTNLTQSWMTRLGQVFGVPAEELIAKPALPNIRRIRVKGAIQAGAWQEG